MANPPEIFICSEDAAAIGRILETRAQEAGEARLELSRKLFEAFVVSQRALPYGTVRLNSRVTYVELPSGPHRVVTIVAPRDADLAAGRISVLSPVGRALLGHAAGGVVHVPLHAGRTLSLRIAAVEATESRSDEAAAASA